MVTYPNSKINLGLNIISKRSDGFHNIETVFFPIPHCDILEIISSDNNQTHFTVTGITPGNPKLNLCIKAYDLIKKDHPQLPEIRMHLHKIIPIGAGLGGGSADAAFTLQLLNRKYDLKIPEQTLFDYALQLGSDCPFFLLNKPALAQGRGEKLEPVPLSLKGYQLLIINPGIHISTAEIFKEVVPAKPSTSIKEIIQQPIENWKNNLVNDFEKIVFKKYPAIQNIKEQLYQKNAVYAAMSGTGSTVFGIFKNNNKPNLELDKTYFQKWIDL